MHFLRASFSKTAFPIQTSWLPWKVPLTISLIMASALLYTDAFHFSFFERLALCCPVGHLLGSSTGLTRPDRMTLGFHSTWLPLKALEPHYLILIIGNVVQALIISRNWGPERLQMICSKGEASVRQKAELEPGLCFALHQTVNCPITDLRGESLD